ncbi:MAG: hypothetical protein ACLS3M_11885 [Collinsella sp.]
MSVNPGFGGQSLSRYHRQTARAQGHVRASRRFALIEVDGGISSRASPRSSRPAPTCSWRSAVFKSESRCQVALLQKLGNEAAQEA